MISIVVGYRNREIERVKRSLDSLSNQTFTDFEIIFVDYGSDTSIATEIEMLVTSYNFTKYIYSDTRGWLWNRAHALNTGVKFTSGDIILLFDIDLILESNFLEKLSNLSFETTFFTFSCFYLPEKFKYFNDLFNSGVHYEQNYVGLCAIKKENIYKIRGFDEYFMVWGVEDDDLYNRLESINISRLQLGQPDFYVFHQWHSTHAPSKPTMWYLQMVQYLSNKKYVQNGKNGNWGNLVLQSDRFINGDLNNLKWDIELRISNESGYLLFNPLIEAIHNPSFNKIYFEFTYEPKKTIKRKWFEFYTTVNTKNILGNISNKEILDFVQHFVGIYRCKLSDYSLLNNNKTIKLGLVKFYESP